MGIAERNAKFQATLDRETEALRQWIRKAGAGELKDRSVQSLSPYDVITHLLER